jgi:Radial spoke protein 3
MAKKYLVGLRFNALNALKDQGMLVEPIEIVMNEAVMPWVLEEMANFIEDEEYQNLNAEDVVRDAFEGGKAQH